MAQTEKGETQKNQEVGDGNLKKNMSLVFEQNTDLKNKKTETEIPLFDESQTTTQRFSPFFRQALASLGSIMGTFSAGMVSGFSATLLPQLAQPDSPINLTSETSSWIASMAALPMFAGCIVSGLIMEPLGRKLTHQILTIPLVIGWVLVATTSALPQLLIGRFMQGFCVGLLGPVGSVYIGEISDPKYRGLLLAGIALAISIGLLVVHIIGTFCRWQMTAALCAIIPLLSYIIISCAPESPSWLARKGKTKKAIESFKWLRGCSPESMDELKAMLEKQQETAIEMQSKPKIAFFSMEMVEHLKYTFKRPEFFKPLFVMITFFFTLQFSGVNAIAFYSVSIMQSTLGSGFNEYAATLIIDGVRLAVSIVACILLRVVGRRPLAMVSGIGTVFSLVGLASFKYLSSKNPDMAEHSWVPLLFLIGYIIFTTSGINPLPWVMTGEVFPVDLRGIGSGISTCMCFVAFFIVVKSAPAMFFELGIEGTFLSYGIIVLFGTCILYFFLPETKGRTLQDIEESFKNVSGSEYPKKRSESEKV